MAAVLLVSTPFGVERCDAEILAQTLKETARGPLFTCDRPLCRSGHCGEREDDVSALSSGLSLRGRNASLGANSSSHLQSSTCHVPKPSQTIRALRNVIIETYHKFARGYLNSKGKWGPTRFVVPI